MARVGVFICHCGVNIAGKVDVAKVAETIGKMPEVALAVDYKFMCSSPGQKLVSDAIKEHGLNRIVVAACSPRMHLPTFQKTIARAGLNPYLISMANIREQCSWVTEDRDKATEKATDLVRRQVRRVAHADPLEDVQVPVEKTALCSAAALPASRPRSTLPTAAARSSWSRRARRSAARWPNSTRLSRPWIAPNAS